MKSKVRVPLLAKVAGLLLANLALLALAFTGFVVWQLGIGMDSLLGGSSGEALRSFGNTVREELISRPSEEWSEAISSIAREWKVEAAILNARNPLPLPFSIPPTILERCKTALPPAPFRPHGPPPPEGPPPPRDPLHAAGPPPFDEGEFDRPEKPGAPGLRENPPRVDPVFLLRGPDGSGYWAGIRISLPPHRGQPPPQLLLLVRSDRMDGAGLFFNLKPWLWGGLGVLVLSVIFWVPLIVGLTRYIGKLTMATERIAAGEFSISLPPRGNDELGHLGQAIESMAMRLDHLIAGQKRFLRDAAHELCAPLARLRTGLGILEMKLGTSGESDLEQVESEAQELADLIRDILAFSRAGNLPLRMQFIAIEELLRQVVDRERAGREVKMELQAGLRLLCDPSLLSRAVGNLVRNAVTHAGHTAEITLRAAETAGWVSITVEDNGVGVQENDLPRVFEPFYRPDRSRTRETGGAGLGLAIVRTAAEACGGRVSAESRENGGFTVTLEFPPANDRGY